MSLLKELKELSLSDIREAFDENNKLKPMDKWPEGLAKCIEAVKVDELYDDDKKNIGRTVQVKLWNKPKAIEMLGKHLKLFTDIIEISKQTTLEDLIMGTRSEHQKKTDSSD
jgi:phage terminase small subunit